MSDEQAPAPDPAPAPVAEAEPAGEGRIAGLPIDAWVRGGTTTQKWDEEQKQLDAQSDYLRDHQDKQYQAVADAETHGGAIAGMFSQQLLHRGNPKVVIEYCYRDSALNRDCLAELYTLPSESNPGEIVLGLVIVCPRCLQRTGRQDKSQLNIRTDIREFYLRSSTDPDYPEDKRIWVNPMDGQPHQIAGTITTRDAIKCPALGCTWKFRIDDSKLKEV